jgi:hypothetical protein
MRAALLRRPADVARCTTQRANSSVILSGHKSAKDLARTTSTLSPPTPCSDETPMGHRNPGSRQHTPHSPKNLSSPPEPPIPRNHLIPLMK